MSSAAGASGASPARLQRSSKVRAPLALTAAVNSRARRVLPSPGEPSTLTSTARVSLTAMASASCKTAISLVRPTNGDGRSGVVAAVVAANVATSPSRPLTVTSPSGS